jgi:hypothetical protein
MFLRGNVVDSFVSTVFPRIKTVVFWRLFKDLQFGQGHTGEYETIETIGFLGHTLSNLHTNLSDLLCLSLEIHQMTAAIIRRKTVESPIDNGNKLPK